MCTDKQHITTDDDEDGPVVPASNGSPRVPSVTRVSPPRSEHERDLVLVGEEVLRPRGVAVARGGRQSGLERWEVHLALEFHRHDRATREEPLSTPVIN